MGNKLYVGNLPFSATPEALRDLFSQFGEVDSVNIISDRATGRSKGFGFVTYKDENAAMGAIQGLNGKDFGGRPLTVSEARPQQNDGGGFRSGGGGGGRGPGGGGGGRDRRGGHSPRM